MLMSIFGTNTRMETFATLIYCVVDHALLQATPDSEHTLLQFISVMSFRPVVCAIDLHSRIDQYQIRFLRT